jgi:integrase
MAWGKAQSEKLAGGYTKAVEELRQAKNLFELYAQHRTRRKSPAEQKADVRRSAMWLQILGDKMDLSKLSPEDWEGFLRRRTSGEIDANGKEVDDVEKRRRVRPATAGADAAFLKGVCHFGSIWRVDGRYILDSNPCRGFEIPGEPNPRRPVVSVDRYLAVRAVAHSVTMCVGFGENARDEQSYTPQLLDFAWHTGRRISAILALRYSDLRLDEGQFGKIHWDSANDKCGKEWLAPINEDLRATINEIRADRQLKGSQFLFPHPNDAMRPLLKDMANDWLIRAEKLAGVAKMDGSLWHAYRRGWATLRKRLPDVDVARAGGWSDLSSLKTCYQHADDDTMLEVVSVSSLRTSTA